MGWAVVPNIHDGNVICQAPCQHRDCAATRKDFGPESKCRICGQGFEAGQRYYYEGPPPQPPVHAVCLEEEVESKRTGGGAGA